MIIAIIILIFISFFFSGSETALTAANKTKFKTEADKGDKKAKGIIKLLEKPSEFITTILIGNNVANILLPTLVTIMALRWGISVGIASAVLTVVIILISEVIPKSVAATFPDKITRLVYPIINICVIVFRPITLLLNKLTDSINRSLSKGQPQEHQFSKEEFKTMLAIAGHEGALNEIETSRLEGVINFENLKVKDVDTTPRINVTSFASNVAYEEVYETVMNKPYTRYPVYEGDIDNIIGVFHSKYLLAWSNKKEDQITNYSAKPLFVNEHNKAEWVLRKMTISRKHLAIVLDEFGGTEAIVSHEDLIEELLGMEIEDEMDKKEKEKLSQQQIQFQQRKNRNVSI
ncbi:Hemolysin-like protein containing CBS domains [Staphylococcus aureus]|uniref:hemolysin family protein n=1 Tax=Staphylococcus aureus TaxID=1280 RepID=UPI00085C3D3C|nr:CNNM domain-containing protein [Staphylococcus aureus]SCU29356.1 Hemolysin-like protein containing CBS domains [Staphylococcus aureus]